MTNRSPENCSHPFPSYCSIQEEFHCHQCGMVRDSLTDFDYPDFDS